jgi:chromosome segregation ATPase
MPRETICVYCEKPLLDAEHAKKHVLEQCTKAPWRARLAELEQKNARLQGELAESRKLGLQENTELGEARRRLYALEDENTRQEGERSAFLHKLRCVEASLAGAVRGYRTAATMPASLGSAQSICESAAGTIERIRAELAGLIPALCAACGGSGRVGDAPCGSCGGSGKGQTR